MYPPASGPSPAPSDDEPAADKRRRAPPLKLPDFLRPGEHERLLAAAKSERDRLAMASCLYMGLRAQECINLRAENLDLDHRQAFIHAGKGKRDAYQRIPTDLIPWLKGYLTGNRLSRGWLFPTSWEHTKNQLGHITQQHLWKIVTTAASDAGFHRHIHPHTLRHTYATDLLRNGVDIVTVSGMLRHKNVATTLIYLHCVTDHYAAAADSLHIPIGQGRLWSVS